MGTEEILNDFVDLIRKESAVISLYDRAKKVVTNKEIKAQFLIFQQDHKRHLQILLDIINNADILSPIIIGEINPQYQDSYEKLNDEKEVLQSIMLKEMSINSLYERTLSRDVDSKTGEILDDNLEDEQQHLAFIKKVLDDFQY